MSKNKLNIALLIFGVLASSTTFAADGVSIPCKCDCTVAGDAFEQAKKKYMNESVFPVPIDDGDYCGIMKAQCNEYCAYVAGDQIAGLAGAGSGSEGSSVSDDFLDLLPRIGGSGSGSGSDSDDDIGTGVVLE